MAREAATMPPMGTVENAMPRLSVCVPLFNKAAAVQRCLGTVLARCFITLSK